MNRFAAKRRAAAGALCVAALVAVLPFPQVLAQPDPFPATASSESPPIAPGAPYTATVKHLLSQLTLEEKLSLVHGQRPLTAEQNLGQAGYTPGIPRLGIPERKDADAVGISVFAETTAPPTKIGVAASFDRAAARALGELEGVEGRAVGIDLMYGPQLDIARIPGASRNQTTAGEDPYLIAELGVAEIHGIQSQGLLSEPKHFALYNQSTNTAAGESQLNVNADQQTLQEIYLAPFEAAIARARPSSIMCSYNKSYGQYSCEQPLLLNDVLRGQWGFQGFVLSDYGATHSLSILQGLDTSFPNGTGPDGSPFFTNDLRALTDPASARYNKGYAEAVDRAVARILYQYERFGLLRKPMAERPVLDRARGQATALNLAERSAVLLKNTDRILPLSRADLASVVVIGPVARQLYVGVGGERSRGFSDRDAISPLMALERNAPEGAKVKYMPGIDWLGEVVPSSALGAGLTRTESDAPITQVDANLDYTGAKTLQPGVTYTWTGTLTVPATDTYNFQLQRSATNPVLANPAGIGTLTLDIDAVRRPLNNPVPGGPVPIITTPDGLFNFGAAVHLTAGTHAIRITYAVPAMIAAPFPAVGPSPPVNLRFAWSAVSQGIAAAADAARRAKIAIVFANDSPGGNATLDRDPATLQAGEDDLIAAVAAANENTIVVLNTGSPVTMPWIASVKAILEMWLPGQEGGTATANVLLGKAVPGGKLPITFPVDVTPMTDHPERFPGVTARGAAALTGLTTETYTEGIFIGYRWYDENRVTPLFPFGHGLSYTSFAYSALQTGKASDGGLNVRFRLTNTGPVAGDEVPQLYLGRPEAPMPSGVQFAPNALAGFTRVHLKPGESADVALHVAPRQLSYWSVAKGTWVVATGDRMVSIGASSRDMRLTGMTSVR